MRALLVILIVVLLVFGTKKLRSIGADLGAAVKGFKRGMAGEDGRKPDVTQPRDQTPDAEFPEVMASRRKEQDGS